MKLYYSPGVCSLASHITLHELGLPFEAVQVDLKSKTTKAGADYNAVNPKGYVPALQFDDGAILTEGPTILQYLADRKPDAGLAPGHGTLARYRLQEWLGFLNSEIHKTFGPLFYADTPEQTKRTAIEKIGKRFDYVQRALDGKSFLMGDQFTIADAYLYTILGWTGYVGIDLGNWPTLKTYHTRIAARPAVQAAHNAEKGN